MGFENNDRDSFRAPVVDGCEGMLRLCDSQFRVCVMNESASGFKLSTHDDRLIPEMVDAVFETDDGVRHVVQVRRVERNGGTQYLGVKRIETRVRRAYENRPDAAKRRLSIAKATVPIVLVAATGFALQATPIPSRITDLVRQNFSVVTRPPEHSVANPAPPSPAPVLAVPRLEFERYIDEDAADWLHLATAQRNLMRSVLDLCGGARLNRLAPSERAFVDFAAQASLLEALDTAQRNRLETELGQPIGGAALLRAVIDRHSLQLTDEDLLRAFGSLLVVSPKYAAHYAVPEDVVAAVSEQLDQIIQAAPVASGEPGDAKRVVQELSLRIVRLEERCRKLLASGPSETAGPSSASLSLPSDSTP